MNIKDKKFEKAKDPESLIDNPSFVGKIIAESEKGRLRLKTLSTLGAENIVWINKDDIVDATEYDDGIVKIDVKQGSEVLVETVRRIQTGSPSLPRSQVEEETLVLLNPPSEQRVARMMQPKPTFLPKDGVDGGGGGGGGGCGNCDWRYITHCTSCTDRNSSQRCARPFFPYP